MNEKYLYSTLLKLRCERDISHKDSHAYRGLAMVLGLLGSRHPRVSEALHQPARDKPITVSPLAPLKGAKGTWCLRLTLMDQALFGDFADAVLSWDPKRELTLGDNRFLLDGIETAPGSDPRVSCISYQNLLECVPTTEQRWKIEFLTPTSFRSKGSHSPFPATPLVFGSLARRWSRFSPLPLPSGLMAALEDQIGIAEYRIGLYRLTFGGFFEPGFTGSCTYSARRNAAPEVLKWAGALARFAYFSGVGAKTTMGMGQARLPIIPSNPRTRTGDHNHEIYDRAAVRKSRRFPPRQRSRY